MISFAAFRILAMLDSAVSPELAAKLKHALGGVKNLRAVMENYFSAYLFTCAGGHDSLFIWRMKRLSVNRSYTRGDRSC
jgi:hypothetical protein